MPDNESHVKGYWTHLQDQKTLPDLCMRQKDDLYGRAIDLALECTTACQPAIVTPNRVIDDASESVIGTP